MSKGRNSTTRDRHRRIIAKDAPPCWICGRPIDYSLDYLRDPVTGLPELDARGRRSWHPMSFVVDHVVPVAEGGADTLDNKRPAHRSCNRAKSDRLDGGPILRRSGTLR